MIDLDVSRAELLANIDAPDVAVDPITDITDPRIASESVRVFINGRARDDLFPLLNLAFCERFAAVPRLELIRDLLVPLKNALGNACRHGNGDDPTKSIAVEIVLTGKGAVLAVTDEGDGFDVALTVRKFLDQASYFANHGSGFRNLQRAKSIVSYENGGRTFLLCFRPSVVEGAKVSKWSAAEAIDSEWLKTTLSAELPEFASGAARIESCRVYGESREGCGDRYVLRIAGRNSSSLETRILTGRLHATDAAAATDFEAAARLHRSGISKSVLIPRPVARLNAEPRLVLYEFDPWMNLWEYLAHRSDVETVERRCERIGRALGRLHRKSGKVEVVVPGDAAEELDAKIQDAEKVLQTATGGPKLLERFRAFVERHKQSTGFNRQRIFALIHGSLGFDSIRYGVDGETYLYRFEASRVSDRGFDLGGFTADLLCFMLANHDEKSYRACRDAFLGRYDSAVEHPMGEEALRFYTVLGLCERLKRAGTEAKEQSGQVCAALEMLM